MIILAYLTIAPVKVKAQDREYQDPLMLKSNKFADAYNDLVVYMRSASPYSLDYRDKIRSIWASKGINSKYEDMYKEVLSDD